MSWAAGPPPPPANPPPAGPPGPPGPPPGSYGGSPPGGWTYGTPPTPPARGRSPLPLLIGVLAIGLLVVAGAVVGMNLLNPTATPTPTALPTLPPTTAPSPTPSPTPSPSPSPTPSPSPSPSPTPSATPTTGPTATAPSGDREREIARLLALVPAAYRDDCEDFAESEQPAISCFSDGISHFYYSYATLDELTAAYEARLELYDIEQDVASCFVEPTPAPCEVGYRVGQLDPAGRVAAIMHEDGYNRVVYTHEPALLLGVVLSQSREYAEVFTFWADELVLDYSP